MKRTVLILVCFFALSPLQENQHLSHADEPGKSLVIGRVLGTRLPYPTMFRDSDLNKAFPDPMIVGGFVVLNNDGERAARIYPKRDGFFFAEVPSGSLSLARFRKDRPRSSEPVHFSILPFEAPSGRIVDLGTIVIHMEGKSVETAMGFSWGARTGEFVYTYSYHRTNTEDDLIRELEERKPDLYQRYRQAPPARVETPLADGKDTSEKEFTEHPDRY